MTLRNLSFALTLFLFCQGVGLPRAVEAQELTAYRKPNVLETAYLALAARLGDPNLCYKISRRALSLGRKPALVRSRCFYFISLRTGDLDWCDEVTMIPVEAALMNWLTPERCRLQVPRVMTNSVHAPPFDHAALLGALGYEKADMPSPFKTEDGIDWKAFHGHVSALVDGAPGSDYAARLAGLPDFSGPERPEDEHLYFTRRDVDREYHWLLNRAFMLCMGGNGGKDCDPSTLARMRGSRSSLGEPGSGKAGLGTARPDGEVGVSDYRQPHNLEKAYYNTALALADATPCRGISPQALAVGWTTDPGLLFMPLRAICLTAVAVTTGTLEPCNELEPLNRDDLDGADLTPDYCRQAVAKLLESPHRRRLSADWEAALQDLGYSAADAGGAEPDWNGLARRLLAPNTALNAEFRARLGQRPDFSTRTERIDPALYYSEAQLQKHLFQLTSTRFHCSVRNPDDDPGVSAPQPQLTQGGAFNLTDHKGRPVTERTYRGEYMLIYFGYTSCPDVCPTSLQIMMNALDLAGAAGEKVRPLFITVDPENDTVALLSDYVPLFGPRLVGLTGSAEQVRRAARGYRVYYFAGEIDGVRTVDHTGYTYLIGPDGRYLAHFEHATDARDMADRIVDIVDRLSSAAALEN